MTMMQTRRHFLTTLAMAGAAALHAPPSLAGEGALETTTVRPVTDKGLCIAPEYVAEDLLRAEGFTDIRYVDISLPGTGEYLARGEVDFDNFAPWNLLAGQIEAGLPIVVLAGVHVGCFEVFAAEGIRHIADLKGKSVGLQGTPGRLLMLMAAYVGLDPVRDIRWVIDPSLKPYDLNIPREIPHTSHRPLDDFAEGKIDAFVAGPDQARELRARKAGHVILNTATDSPFSQYFCCMLTGNRDYVAKYPVATKRVLRAVLKAADLCVSQPERTAQRLVDRGFTDRFDYALDTIRSLPYSWRDYDPEDSMRFYFLRMHETGLIKSNPNKLIADGTDWRFLDELKRELKA
jgi:NitT/TauT family transport system substrate-binding protein